MFLDLITRVNNKDFLKNNINILLFIISAKYFALIIFLVINQ